MKTFIHHIHLNVSEAEKSLPFYESFLKYLGYRIIDQGADHLGASNGTTDLWIVQADRQNQNRFFHRKEVGLNHIAFRVSTKKEVDRFTQKFLKPRKIKQLYRSPRIFPEYHKGYYAVYFEDPDRVKLEVVYIPKFRDRAKAVQKILLWDPLKS